MAFKPSRESDRKAAVAAINGDKQTRSSEERMPFTNIEGPLLRCKDGGTCIYLHYPGANLSIMTEKQRQDYAFVNAQILSTIDADVAAIWILPDTESSEANLMLVDHAISRHSERILKTSTATEADKRKLVLLEQHVRPSFAREAVASEDVEWRTYLGLKYWHKNDEGIIAAAKGLQVMIGEKLKKEAAFLGGSYEILDFIELYFTGAVKPERFIGPKVVMPNVR